MMEALYAYGITPDIVVAILLAGVFAAFFGIGFLIRELAWIADNRRDERLSRKHRARAAR